MRPPLALQTVAAADGVEVVVTTTVWVLVRVVTVVVATVYLVFVAVGVAEGNMAVSLKDLVDG